MFGVLGQIFINIALKHEEPTKVAIAKTSDVIIAFFLQYIFLNIQIDFLSIIGSLAIVVGTMVVLIFKLIENKYSKLANKKKNCLEKFIFFKF